MQVVAYKYKVYSQNRNHQKRLEELLRTAAWIYNHCIALCKRYYKLYKKTLRKAKLQSHIAKIKKRCYLQWWAVDAQATQQIIDRIFSAYDKFFKKENSRPPSFRNWRKYKSITFKQSGYTLNGNVFTINKLKLRLKFHLSRPIEGKIQTVCLKRDAVGDWWLSFTIRKNEEIKKLKPKTGKTAGLDFGIKHFLTNNNGDRFDAPLHLYLSISELRHKTRSLSRKREGSNSMKKAQKELSRFYRKITNLRTDFYWKLANKIADEYDTIYMETLDVKEMYKRWGRKLSDLCIVRFMEYLSVICKKHQKRLVFINQWSATSKTCSDCGFKLDELSLKTRMWVCPKCGAKHERDINAAKNILRVGMSTLGGDCVRPTS